MLVYTVSRRCMCTHLRCLKRLCECVCADGSTKVIFSGFGGFGGVSEQVDVITHNITHIYGISLPLTSPTTAPRICRIRTFSSAGSSTNSLLNVPQTYLRMEGDDDPLDNR